MSSKDGFCFALFSQLNVAKGGGGSTLIIQDEGVQVEANVNTINFIGADVQAMAAGSGIVAIYIPPPAFASHFNTTDGTTTGTVTENISRTTAFIAAPTSEGVPFSTGGWAGSNQAATTSTSVTFTTGGEVTGFGGNSTLAVTVYDANGSTVLETVTTAAITGDGSYGSGNITITIAGYAADTTRFKATPTISVAINTLLAAQSPAREGGRYNVVSVMTTDTATDGTGPYTYTQPAVFLDTNPSTPSVSATPTIGETGGSVLTKHLSGLEYYILNSAFTMAVPDMDNLNRNTARTSQNLRITSTGYNIGTLNQSPLSGGAGNSNFSGWTSNYNVQNVSYTKTNYQLTASSYRYRATGAKISALVRDSWANSSTVNSATEAILIDTYGTTSTDLVEDFDDENRRQTANWNNGTSAGNWNSTTALVAGEAQVIGGELIVPSQATLTTGGGNANWTAYQPDNGGSNPNYSSLGGNVNYYRTIVDSVGSSRAGFTISFSGTFVSNATTDLANEHLKIFLSRVASSNGGNAGPTNTDLLNIHGALYNFNNFDDGVTNGQIREGSSSANTVNCTFGGYVCENGFYLHVLIANTAIRIDRLSVSFS